MSLAVDLLMGEGYHVHLANPAEIKKYRGLKYADDQHDAFWLAKCCGWGYCPRDIFIQGKTGQYTIFCVSACTW